MDELALLVSLHRPNARLGPGSDATTQRALDLTGLRGREGLHIADLGCGTGASAIALADSLDGHITAVDLFPEFLDELTRRATARGVHSRITPVAASFDTLPFEEASLDLIWSEGAIYNLGFESGVRAWRSYLRPGGVLAVSEITWLTATRPNEIQAHWDAAYPEIATASEKIAVLEACGLSPVGYFPLSETCWLDNYYGPLRERFSAFLDEHDNADAARDIVEGEEREIALYERYHAFVGYGFYLARRPEA